MRKPQKLPSHNLRGFSIRLLSKYLNASEGLQL